MIITSGETSLDAKGNEIVFYGKLTVQKGAFRLLKYFQELWDSGFSRPLFVLGGQDIVYHPEGRTMGDIIRKKYKKYIDSNLLRLEGQIKPSEIGTRLAKAEVVIIPSDNDNLPYVVFEMMALGRIVLVSKQGGQSEVVENGKDGFIFDHNDPRTFFGQLKLILALDQGQRTLIGTTAAQKIGERYSSETVYGQKMLVIDRLLSKKNEPADLFPFLKPGVAKSMDSPGNGFLHKGRLSIVVPYYNMGAFIDETISSLRGSTFPDMEIIIVNDGSTDAMSLGKLNVYRQATDVKVVDLPNGGLAGARNHGAQVASGEWLAFLDADDTVQPGYYNRAISVLKQYNNVHFVGCWVKYFGNSGNVWPAFTPEPPLILNHNTVNSSALVYKRVAFLAAGRNDPNMLFQGYEDYESVVSMLANGFHGVVIPEPLFNYRVRANSMYRAISKSKKLNLYQHISNKHHRFYGSFAVELFNLLNANGPGILLDNPSLDYHLADKMPVGGKLSRMIIALMKKNRLVKTVAYKMYKMLKK
jgi:glycosyltransferase involved in cell wall biosynthesis